MSLIEGKTVLITGGASGIGKIMCRRVLEKGAAQLIIWDIDAENAEAARTELSALGQVSFYHVDLSDHAAIDATAARVRKENGRIDILINNAGITVGKYFHEHSSAEIRRTMMVNAHAPMLLSSAFLPDMIEADAGHICNIASLAGLISNPKMSVYAASKWACIGWSDSLRLEMKKLGKQVRVTTVAPYYMSTGMFEGVRSRLIPILKPERMVEKIIRGIEKDRIMVAAPIGYRSVRFLQGLLGIRGFDLVAGDWFGIYDTMDDFVGRKKRT